MLEVIVESMITEVTRCIVKKIFKNKVFVEEN